MSAFTADELGYLQSERRLGRVATVGKEGTPHVTPVGWSYNAELETIDVGGRQFEKTKKYRDVKGAVGLPSWSTTWSVWIHAATRDRGPGSSQVVAIRLR